MEGCQFSIKELDRFLVLVIDFLFRSAVGKNIMKKVYLLSFAWVTLRLHRGKIE